MNISQKKYPGALSKEQVVKLKHYFETDENIEHNQLQDDSVFKRYKAQTKDIPDDIKLVLEHCILDANKTFDVILHDPVEFQRFIFSKYQTGDFLAQHHDLSMPDVSDHQKLTCVVLLNNDFEGGDFCITLQNKYGKEPHKVKFETGDVLIFPSWVQHHVTPIKSGIRKSMTTWIMGPRYR